MLLSTHQTEDVAALCDRVVVLDAGRIRFDGAVLDLVTTVAQRLATPAPATTLRTLAAVEARRYARHPLFLVGVALLVWSTVSLLDDVPGSGNVTAEFADVAALPAFFLGLPGVFVGHGLARSLARAGDAVQAAPTDGARRTAALCLACLVPGAAALVWVGWTVLALADSTLLASAISAVDWAGMLATGVVAAVGGPLLGVLVGRWPGSRPRGWSVPSS